MTKLLQALQKLKTLLGYNIQNPKTPCPFSNTCQWTFEDPKFKNWLASHDAKEPCARLLTIFGDPGSGKTVLMNSIVERFRQEPSLLSTTDGEAPIVLYHSYNGPRNIWPFSHAYMLYSLCQQLVQAHKLKGKEYALPDPLGWFNSNLDRFTTLLIANPGSYYIFLDGPSGFDMKCPIGPSHDYKTDNFLKSLDTTRLRNPSGKLDIKICYACRPEGRFRDILEMDPNMPTGLKMERKNNTDIEEFWAEHQELLENPPSMEDMWYQNGKIKDTYRFFPWLQYEIYLLKKQHKPSMLTAKDDMEQEMCRKWYRTMLHEATYNFQPERLEKLSVYINRILAHDVEPLRTLRADRPFTLLEFTLADLEDVKPSEVDNEEFVEAACKEMSRMINQKLHPFIVVSPPNPNIVLQRQPEIYRNEIHRLSVMTVTLLYHSMSDFFLNTEEGRAFLGLDQTKKDD